MKTLITLILILMAVKSKAQLHTDIDTVLASASNITAAEHRGIEGDIVDSMEIVINSYTTAQIAALVGMTERQIVYNTDDNDYEFYDGTRWVKMAHPKYKVYKATFNDGSPPVETVKENTLGTVSWASGGAGSIIITATGLLTTGKTNVIFSPNYADPAPEVPLSFIYDITNNSITIRTYDLQTGTPAPTTVLNDAYIEIQVEY